MKHCLDFLEEKLRLRVNREKGQVGSPLRRKLLGFSLNVKAKGKWYDENSMRRENPHSPFEVTYHQAHSELEKKMKKGVYKS